MVGPVFLLCACASNIYTDHDHYTCTHYICDNLSIYPYTALKWVITLALLNLNELVSSTGYGKLGTWPWKGRLSWYGRKRRVHNLRILACIKLTISQVSEKVVHVRLSDVTKVERAMRKRHCLLVEWKNKQFYLSLSSDDELYEWQDAINTGRLSSKISFPWNFRHEVHVGFHPDSGFYVSTMTRPRPTGQFKLFSFSGIARFVAWRRRWLVVRS